MAQSGALAPLTKFVMASNTHEMEVECSDAVFCVLEKKYRIYIFKGLSRGNRRFCSTTEMPKCLVF